MNYFALAGGIIAGLITLRAVLLIAVVSAGFKRFAAPSWGFTVNAGFAAVFGTLAVWLFGMVAA